MLQLAYRYLRNLTLFLFIFSIPFYTWDGLQIIGDRSFPRMMALFYTGISLLSFRESFNLNQLKGYIYPLLFLFFWMFIATFISYYRHPSPTDLINSPTGRSKYFFDFSFFQYILLSVLLINHLKGNKKLIYAALITFSTSVLLLSVLISLGIGIDVTAARISFFGENQNNTAIRAAFACAFILYILLDTKILGYWKYVVLITIPQYLFIIGATGSRGALVALAVSIVIMVLFLHTTPFRKSIIVFLISLIAIFLFIYMQQFPDLIQRMNQLLAQGDLAREGLYLNFLKASLIHPIFGSGVNGYVDICHKIFGQVTSPHNWFLYVLLVGGIIGLSAFLLFHYRVYNLTRKIKTIDNNTMPLALFIIVLVHISKSGTELTDITIWFILSVIIAWGIHTNNLSTTITPPLFNKKTNLT